MLLRFVTKAAVLAVAETRFRETLDRSEMVASIHGAKGYGICRVLCTATIVCVRVFPCPKASFTFRLLDLLFL